MDAFTRAAQPNGDFVKFKSVGDSVTIGITGITERQSIDFNSKAPKTFPSGDPIMEQWIAGVKLDPETYEGDEDVVLVVDKKLMRQRIGQAVIDAGGAVLEEGAVLTVTYKGDGVAPKGSSFAPKDFAVAYELPEAEEEE
jgi:hypothetical protein